MKSSNQASKNRMVKCIIKDCKGKPLRRDSINYHVINRHPEFPAKDISAGKAFKYLTADGDDLSQAVARDPPQLREQ